MNFKFSLKSIICLLLAIVMLLTTVGCAEKTKKKKKKIIKKKVVVVQKDDDSDEDKNNNIIIGDSVIQENASDFDEEDDDSDDFYPDVLPDVDETKPMTVWRKIPELNLTKNEKYVEVFTPEFESENVDWQGPDGFTIVYDSTNAANKVLADKLATFFKDNDNVILEVKKDTDLTLSASSPLILVGDTVLKTSKLKQTEFAVTKLENGNLFFEGGHDTMVEKAVDWFRTVDREEGKVAVLTGTQEDFVTDVSVLGKDYVYVWGDEFDGEELYDNSKWTQRDRTIYSDLVMVHNDPHFQYVEGGRIRLTSDRYFDPTDGQVGWGSHGSCNSIGDMIFKNGYLEMKVRFDFGQGSFPALWLMTNDSPLEKYVPNYEQYKERYFDLETDIFEFFGKGTHAAANMHKWYKSNEQVEIIDEDGNKTGQYRVFGLNGVDLTDSYKFLRNTRSSGGRYSSFSWGYPDNISTFNFSDEETETLYKDYHIYQMLYEGNSVKFGIDNNWYCEWPLDIAFDYIDGIDPTNNNNGIGYNLWHYLFLDQYVYPPSRMGEKGADAVITTESAPLNTYVDYVRLYQLPDDIAVITSAEADNDLLKQ